MKKGVGRHLTLQGRGDVQFITSGQNDLSVGRAALCANGEKGQSSQGWVVGLELFGREQRRELELL